MTTTDVLDPVRRLRILAGAHPGCCLVETVIPAPFERVWKIAGDLEHGVPRYERTIRTVTVTGYGERVTVTTRDLTGRRRSFFAILRPGWCWMQSGQLLVGIAARPEGDGTRLAHLEGVRSPLARPLARFLGPKLRAEIKRIAQHAMAQASEETQ